MSKFLKQFWWARGAVAAMALLSILGPVFDLKRYELLRVIHAIIVGWTEFITAILAVVRNFVPVSIHPLAVNMALVILTTSIPLLLSSVRLANGKYGLLMKVNRFQLFTAIFALTSILMTISAAYLVNNLDKEVVYSERTASAIELVIQNEEEHQLIDRSGEALPGCLIDNSLKQYYCFEKVMQSDLSKYLSLDEADEIREITNLLRQSNSNLRSLYDELMYFVVTLMIGSVIFMSIYFARYRAGVFHFCVFLLTVEILYFLPLVGGFLENTADKILAGLNKSSRTFTISELEILKFQRINS